MNLRSHPFAVVLLALLAAAILAAPRARAEAPVPLADDPALARLVEESLAARPEVKAAAARVRIARERVPQAGALPDPVLSLGIQNDGFRSIEIGKMETSFWSIGAAQTLPWPGKRGLRTDVADLAVREADASLARARLSAEADVRRAYLDLLLVRDRLALLVRLEMVWERSEGVARGRYESGEAAQTDLLRAQLERTRLRQRRVGLEAEERARRAEVNRLRGRPAGDPVETAPSLAQIADPALPAVDAAVAYAEERSPELAGARVGQVRAARQVDLARRERFPDVTLSAGVMPRGALEPMWQAGISIPIPLFSGRKQGRAVAERAADAEANRADAEAAAEVVRLRAIERYEALAAALDTLKLFRGGLLVQSRATAQSALAQYGVGRVPFTTVLEAVAGNVSDEDAFLSAAADAQKLAVAMAEVSVDATFPGVVSAGGMAGGGVSSAATKSGGRGGAAAAAGAAAAGGGSTSSSMGGGM
ncbi:TolC family protein [Anaeromyxobacter oryzae]|uniref:RND transporter n=1 Tax=Anaeromyxobacter oryzae TaxID=2918170 RepID=A0ABN6MU88_9BACT|nr:TolC family protein [Anaeromyxobacter oryzae]BDG03210.1 RND transporter [Anaeromyxobacter oryzae]